MFKDFHSERSATAALVAAGINMDAEMTKVFGGRFQPVVLCSLTKDVETVNRLGFNARLTPAMFAE